MSVHARRPSITALRSLLLDARDAPLTYAPAGISLSDAAPPAGLVRRRWTVDLVANASFDRARRALERWEVHRAARLSVEVDGPVAVGTHVAMSAPLPIGFVDAVCRIVAVIDEPDGIGFAYGTLPVHPELGEESFIIDRTGATPTFRVEAVSRAAHPLARLAPPVANTLQNSAAQRYLAAMRSITG